MITVGKPFKLISNQKCRHLSLTLPKHFKYTILQIPTNHHFTRWCNASEKSIQLRGFGNKRSQSDIKARTSQIRQLETSRHFSINEKLKKARTLLLLNLFLAFHSSSLCNTLLNDPNYHVTFRLYFAWVAANERREKSASRGPLYVQHFTEMAWAFQFNSDGGVFRRKKSEKQRSRQKAGTALNSPICDVNRQ